jgi:predicted phosphodiesterase
MATVVLMSDIHGNFTALSAVAETLPEAEAVYVAGDLCLEGPRPAEVVDFIRERGWIAVRGNTDEDILAPPSGKKGAVAEWTRQQLGSERLRWLEGLPFSTRYERAGIEEILVVHANPLDLEAQLHPTMTEKQLEPYLKPVDAKMLAFGHLHIPYIRPVDGIVLADVSSVGHPKDLDRRAAYVVVRYEGDRRSIEQVRVPYDIEETVRQMHESGLPDADRHTRSLLRASY